MLRVENRFELGTQDIDLVVAEDTVILEE